jgi:hypothetical protein
LSPADGSIVWLRGFGGSSYEYASRIAVDASNGHVYVSGRCSSSTITVAGTTLTRTGGYDVLVIKLFSNGTAAWGKLYGGSGDDQPNALAAGSDYLYVVGQYTAIMTLGSTTLSYLGGYLDAFVARLSRKDGSVVWAKSYSGTGYDVLQFVTVDASGYPYIAGGTSSGWWVVDGANITTDSGQFFTAKLHPGNGSAVWAKFQGGKNAGVTVNGFDYDSSSASLFVAGSYTTTLSLGGSTLSHSGTGDAVVAKLSASGWHRLLSHDHPHKAPYQPDRDSYQGANHVALHHAQLSPHHHPHKAPEHAPDRDSYQGANRTFARAFTVAHHVTLHLAHIVPVRAALRFPYHRPHKAPEHAPDGDSYHGAHNATFPRAFPVADNVTIDDADAPPLRAAVRLPHHRPHKATQHLPFHRPDRDSYHGAHRATFPRAFTVADSGTFHDSNAHPLQGAVQSPHHRPHTTPLHQPHHSADHGPLGGAFPTAELTALIGPHHAPQRPAVEAPNRVAHRDPHLPPVPAPDSKAVSSPLAAAQHSGLHSTPRPPLPRRRPSSQLPRPLQLRPPSSPATPQHHSLQR